MTVELTPRELRRFENQMKLPGIGPEGQEKLKKAKVVIAGAGGIGTNIMLHLATAGIGTLGIIDNAIVEETNLHRQVLYGSSDLGKQKAIVSKQKLAEINPQATINIHNLTISSSNSYKICDNYDLIIDATNSWDSFECISAFCLGTKKPMIYCKIDEYIVEISTITDFQEFKGALQKDTKRKSGFISPISGIAGSFASLEAIKLLSGIENLALNKTIVIDTLNFNISI